MRSDRRTLVVLILSFLFLIFLTDAASAGTDSDSFFSPIITFIAVIGLIVLIIGLLTAGGIKYVTPENVLDTEIRKNLFGYITDYPGSHLREIARELKLKPSNAAWHLRKLEQTNLVRSRAIGGKKVFYIYLKLLTPSISITIP